VVSVLTEAVARLLLAPAVMVAAAILVKGYADVGDGFSAAVIVSLAVACQYLALGAERAEQELPLLRHAPRVAVAGVLVALAAGFFGLVAGEPPFSHEPAPGVRPVVIGRLELMTPVLFDVGVFMIVAGSLVTLLHTLARPPLTGDDDEEATA
jgi:multicomponent Na+:H+ antiporter subunit B